MNLFNFIQKIATPNKAIQKETSVGIVPTDYKFKYLKYLPKPMYLNKSDYDLVDDDEFFKKDNRIPLIMLINYGIFPPKGHYNLKPNKDITVLEGLENQTVGFIRKRYRIYDEKKDIVLMYPNDKLIQMLIKEPSSILTYIANPH